MAVRSVALLKTRDNAGCQTPSLQLPPERPGKLLLSPLFLSFSSFRVFVFS